MNILISAIGQRDPVPKPTPKNPNPEEGAILTAFRAIQPDHVFLIGNHGAGIPDNTELTRLFLLEVGLSEDHVHTFVAEFEDPTDYPLIYQEYGRVFAEIQALTKGWKNCEYTVALSSGTQQISQVLMMLLDEGIFPHAKRIAVREPRFVTDSNPRVYEVALEYTHESRLKLQLGPLFDRHRFNELCESLQQISHMSVRPERIQGASELARVAAVLTDWDRFEYSGALQRLRERKVRDTRWPELMQSFLQTLEQLARTTSEGRYSDAYLLDLYHNAERRLDEGRLDYALMQYWHLWEQIVFSRMLKLGINPDDLEKSEDRERLETIKETQYLPKSKKQFVYDSKKRDLDRQSCTLLLDVEFRKDDPEWRPWNKECESHILDGKRSEQTRANWLNKLRTARNRSFAGHGVEPVRDDVVQLARTLTGDALVEMLHLSMETYPLAPNRLDLIREALIAL